MILTITLYALFLIVGAYMLLRIPKGEISLYVNRRSTPFKDVFIKYYTNMGDGTLYIPFAALAVLFYGFKVLFPMVTIFLLQTLIVQVLKRKFFKGSLRPKPFLEDRGHKLHFVKGIRVHGFNTFPSGHTTSAFAMATQLIWALNLEMGAVLVFGMALLVGFSRIYLMQHFFRDVYFGSIIGCFSAIVSIVLFTQVWPIDFLSLTNGYF